MFVQVALAAVIGVLFRIRSITKRIWGKKTPDPAPYSALASNALTRSPK
jgi:hypothetical protein